MTQQKNMILRKYYLPALLILAGISVCTMQAGAKEPDIPRITGILPYKSETVYWQEVTDQMEETSQEHEAELTMLYTEETVSYTELTLNDALEIAVLTDPGAVILPYSRADEETDTLLMQLREQGVGVVLIDCDGAKDIRDAYVGIDNEAAGYALGSYILENLKEGECAVLSATSAAELRLNLKERISGIQRAFESEPDRLHIFTPTSDMEVLRARELADYIEGMENAGALVTLSERSTITGAQVLSNLGKTDGIDLYGFDQTDETMKLLEDKKLRALVGQQHRQMGEKSVEAALKLIGGESLPSDSITIDYELIYGEDGI